jgi:DNA-binding NarL/FixJ family response regulator
VIREFADRAPHRAPPAGLAELTERERAVLGLLVGGRSNAEIAADLIIGEATVKTHVTRILAKLQVRDRVQAVILAYETGVVGLLRSGSPGER